MKIKLVTFDALHTLITPRLPIYVQYSQTFAPYLGVLEPDALSKAFKVALKQLQQERPGYQGADGAQGWWSEVIRRTAIGAGADKQAVDGSLHEIVPKLMMRFSSKEGYKLFEDSLPVLRELQRMNIRTALISNSDARMRLVLQDLGILQYFTPVLLSEEEGVEKPDPEIYLRVRKIDNATNTKFDPQECVHVGDELVCDYQGAIAAKMHALLIRRQGPDGEGESKEVDEDLNRVEMVDSLWGVVAWVRRQNTNLIGF